MNGEDAKDKEIYGQAEHTFFLHVVFFSGRGDFDG
jgi:hypothetical protein